MAHALQISTVALRPTGEAAPRPRRARQKADVVPPHSRIGSWHVDRELGRGGMASVHAVVHTKYGNRAAIKIAHASVLGDAYTAQTFLREARIARSIEHPGMVAIHATGDHEGRPYIVMEQLIGVPLGQRVDAGPPIPRREAIAMLLELCSVLRAAHGAGVVHRDLKLDNVFLCDTGRVKLLDWGVAHRAGEEDPFRGLIAGTLTYVAPEQIRGGAITPAADIYSLAVLAYQLLCRRPPFAAVGDLALIQLHLRAEPPRASTAWPEIPDALDDLLERMLAKEPAERPTLDEVEAVLRTTTEAQRTQGGNPSRRFASLWPQWLCGFSASAEPPPDVLGRPVLPVPPLTPGWIAAALALAGLAGLVAAIA